jgi:hypothetical protein
MYDVSYAQKQGKEKAAGQPNPKTESASFNYNPHITRD